MTEFGMIIRVGEKHVSVGVSDVPIPKGQGSASPKFWDPLPTSKRFDLQRRNLVWWHMWGV